MFPILSSYEKVLDHETLAVMASIGFKAVNMCIVTNFQKGQEQEYADRIRWLSDLHRNAGLKFFMRWPSMDRLGITTPENCHRSWDGGDGGMAGPSYWDEESLQTCIGSLGFLNKGDVDGLLVNPIITDCPFPTWEPNVGPIIDIYWCHDAAAKRDYAKTFGDFPMPNKPGDPEPEGFYEWYQGALLKRYHQLSEAALRITDQLLLWFTPMLGCRSSAQPGLEVGVEKWRQWVLSQGGKQPFFVIMSLFPFSPWGPEVFARVREICDPDGAYGWNCIGGIMHADTEDAALLNLKYNAPRLAEMGMVGFSTGIPAVANIPGEVKDQLDHLSTLFREIR